MDEGKRRILQNLITNYRLKGWGPEKDNAIVRIVRVAAQNLDNPHAITKDELKQLLIDNGLDPFAPDA